MDTDDDEGNGTPRSRKSSIPSDYTAPILATFSDDDEDDSWQLVTDTKPTGPLAWLFVGNLQSDIDESTLRQYMSARADRVKQKVKVNSVKIFPKDGKASARVSVNLASASTVKTRSFWHQ